MDFDSMLRSAVLLHAYHACMLMGGMVDGRTINN